jgi:hypothetical protein
MLCRSGVRALARNTLTSSVKVVPVPDHRVI